MTLQEHIDAVKDELREGKISLRKVMYFDEWFDRIKAGLTDMPEAARDAQALRLWIRKQAALRRSAEVRASIKVQVKTGS